MKRKIFAVAAVFIGSQLYAQQDSIKKMDDVVVTANKYPNKTSLTGKVVTVIDRTQIERSGGKSLSQLLNEQLGMYIGGSNSNSGKDKSVYLRGAAFDYTLITIDGVPVYDASGIGSNFDIRLLPLDNIERIEILKGSQSTLYGSDAMAGVINIITRKAGNEKINATGSLSYGSYNTTQANAAIRGKEKLMDYNLSYSYFNTKGINEAIDSVKNNPVHVDKDGYQEHNVYAGIGIQASKNIHIQPYLRYAYIKGDNDLGSYLDELDYNFRMKNTQLGIRNEFSFGKVKLNMLYNFTNTDRKFVDDSSSISPYNYNKYSLGLLKSKEHYAEVYIVHPFADLFKLTAGVDYRSSNTDQQSVYLSAFDPSYDFSSSISSSVAKQNQLGVYAAINMNTGKGFNAELGGRYNKHSTYGSNFVFNVNPSYLLNDQWKFFANLSSAYKVPTLYQLFSDYGNKDLKPQTALTIEGGLQYFSRDRKVNTRITYFYRSVKDVIIFYTDMNTFISKYINQDKQKDNGIELEASINLIKNSSIKLFYSYVDGDVTTKNAVKDTTYFNLIRRPKHSLGISFGTQITKAFYIGSNLNFYGKRAEQYFDNTTFQTISTDLNSYLLWNVYAEYGFLHNKLKVFTDLRNISNSSYVETFGYNTMGFNAYTGIRFSIK